MTTEQINIAIAEACGWTGITLRAHDMGELPPRLAGFHKEAGVHKFLPNYCNDLNAMHEAEKTLTLQQLVDMQNRLAQFEGVLPFHSTARQRAKAFLQTLGKWEEGNWEEVGKCEIIGECKEIGKWEEAK